MMTHFQKFDKLCLTMQTIGDELRQDEQMVIFLGSYKKSTFRS